MSVIYILHASNSFSTYVDTVFAFLTAATVNDNFSCIYYQFQKCYLIINETIY